MKKKILLILSYLLFSAGLIILFYSCYSILFPKYEFKTEILSDNTDDKPLPEILDRWDKEIVCSRTNPTPLFLNFYGNIKYPWIAILFGREKEIARTFIFPKRIDGRNIVTYSRNENYLKNFIFTKEEENFLRICVYNVFMPKTAL